MPWRREEPSVTWNDTRFARCENVNGGSFYQNIFFYLAVAQEGAMKVSMFYMKFRKPRSYREFPNPDREFDTLKEEGSCAKSSYTSRWLFVFPCSREDHHQESFKKGPVAKRSRVHSFAVEINRLPSGRMAEGPTERRKMDVRTCRCSPKPQRFSGAVSTRKMGLQWAF